MFDLNNFEYLQVSLASPEIIRGWSHGEVTKPETINYRTQKPEKDGLFCEKIFGPTKEFECHCGKYKRIRYKGIVCDKCGVEVTHSKVRRERMGHIELAAPVSHIWYFKGVPSRMRLILDMQPKHLEDILYFNSYVVLDPKETDLKYKQILKESEFAENQIKYGSLLFDVRCVVADPGNSGMVAGEPFLEEEVFAQKRRFPTFEVKFIVVASRTPEVKEGLDIQERDINEYRRRAGEKTFRVGMGAEAVKEMLQRVNLEEDFEIEKSIIKNANSNSQNRIRAIKRLEILDAFMKSGNHPEWMILDVLPVIPPDIRPMVQLDGGRFATSDLNDLYRRVINRNNRLKKLIELGAPELIVRNEKRMLQEAVDALIDNGRKGKAVSGPGNRELKSLSGMLRGKQGRFRQNLLGKRVDYSGRSVIVVGPTLQLNQCGLPKEMALELFKPFVMKKLVEFNISHNIKNARRIVERQKPIVWDMLEKVIKDHPVMLNRAPTLHRLGIQAFEPVLVEGRALKIHPLVCSAFNADFDGDQMAVHVPLSVEAQAEARFLMLSTNNILKLSDGKPILSPTQDMVIGCYYLTIEKPGAKGEGKYFKDFDEAMLAYISKDIELQTRIKVRITRTYQGESYTRLINTSLGRLIFNEALPQDMGFVKRETLDDMFKLEVDKVVGKKELSQIVDRAYKAKGATETCAILDRIKAMGFKYATIGAVTTSVFDMTVPPKKQEILHDAEEQVIRFEKMYKRGLMTSDEKYQNVIKTWTAATDKVTEELKTALGEFNPIYMMATSGARGNMNQIKQLSGMRGLMNDPSGKTIETPVRSSFREGLSVLEYFISSHGGRKGLADTALKTADSGYLTRRLVDVSQDVIVNEEDCFEVLGEDPRGQKISSIVDGPRIVERLDERLYGRYTVEAVINPNTKEVIVPANTMITEEQAKIIFDAGITEVNIRTAFTCKSRHGVCAKCYGRSMADQETVKIGEAVGIIAAQSIGEPGTQLTMRTFHTGGVATAADITQGLPRVEELFEGRRPKGAAIICEYSGKIKFLDKDNKPTEKSQRPDRIEISTTEFRRTPDGEREEKVKKYYDIPFNAKIKSEIVDNMTIHPGDIITEGPLNPHDILKTRGIRGVQEYILKEVLIAYRSQGVDISDKHVEIIVRQMLKKVKVEDSGDAKILPGELIDVFEFEDANEKVLDDGGIPAVAKHVLLGITKASLATDSFLSAASFQETAKVLTEASIKKKVDNLVGLKENVILGKLIPAGTGMKQYKNISPEEVR